MLDPSDLAEYSQTLSAQEVEAMQERLALFQTFTQLYEHHRDRLDEFLTIQDSDSAGQGEQHKSFYVQGIATTDRTYLVSNLVGGESRHFNSLAQQWIFGRDPRQANLVIGDKRLSRTHATIEYSEEQGFIISDLDSTNGTYVNGQRIKRCYALRDGDQLRLGGITFSFYMCTLLSQGESSPSVGPVSAKAQSENDPEVNWDSPLELLQQTLRYHPLNFLT